MCRFYCFTFNTFIRSKLSPDLFCRQFKISLYVNYGLGLYNNIKLYFIIYIEAELNSRIYNINEVV